jgi:hypothetical protein
MPRPSGRFTEADAADEVLVMEQQFQAGRMRIEIRPDQGGPWGHKLPRWHTVTIYDFQGRRMYGIRAPIGSSYDDLDARLAASGFDQLPIARRFAWLFAGCRPMAVIRGDRDLIFAKRVERALALHDALGSTPSDGRWQWHARPQHV